MNSSGLGDNGVFYLLSLLSYFNVSFSLLLWFPFIILIFAFYYFNFLNKKMNKNRTHGNGSACCRFCRPFVYLAHYYRIVWEVFEDYCHYTGCVNSKLTLIESIKRVSNTNGVLIKNQFQLKILIILSRIVHWPDWCMPN